MNEGKDKYKLCPGCNFFCNVKEPDKFCSLCGKVLIANCPSCGSEISNPYAKYCKHCGTLYPNKKIANSTNTF